MTPDICIVTASNDEECLTRNLMASPMVAEGGVPVHVERGAPSAAIAYNRGLAATTAPFVIFAHQDVYFPRGWEEQLARAIAQLETMDANWALVGPFGMSPEGAHIGDVWTTSLSRRIGAPLGSPQPVQSFDELAIVMRRDAGLNWDDSLPGYHMYGTDIVQSARARGQGAYVADLPVVHNDGFHGRLGADFTASYRWMQRKWRAVLPLRTPVVQITRTGLALAIYRLRAHRSFARRQAVAGDAGADPKLYAAQCGLE